MQKDKIKKFNREDILVFQDTVNQQRENEVGEGAELYRFGTAPLDTVQNQICTVNSSRQDQQSRPYRSVVSVTEDEDRSSQIVDSFGSNQRNYNRFSNCNSIQSSSTHFNGPHNSYDNKSIQYKQESMLGPADGFYYERVQPSVSALNDSGEVYQEMSNLMRTTSSCGSCYDQSVSGSGLNRNSLQWRPSMSAPAEGSEESSKSESKLSFDLKDETFLSTTRSGSMLFDCHETYADSHYRPFYEEFTQIDPYSRGYNSRGYSNPARIPGSSSTYTRFGTGTRSDYYDKSPFSAYNEIQPNIPALNRRSSQYSSPIFSSSESFADSNKTTLWRIGNSAVAGRGKGKTGNGRLSRGGRCDGTGATLPIGARDVIVADMPSPANLRKEVEQNRGNLLNMSLQQVGCRHLQMLIDQEGMVIVEMLFDEIGPNMSMLMVNPFGNYLFQKLVEMSTDQQRRELLKNVKSSLRMASKDAHGTRCVQKLIQICRHPDMVEMILDGICPFVVELSADVNGNHVIKRCMSSIATDLRTRLFDCVIAQCIDISKKTYGCCVVQKCIDLAPPVQLQQLLNMIEKHSLELMKDRFANYVVQYLIDNAPQQESLRFCKCVIGHVEELSKEKCSSNVVEKSLTLGDETTRAQIIEEIVNSSSIHDMLIDGFANYVIQKALALSNKEQRAKLTMAILPYQHELTGNKSGKHILAKIADSSISTISTSASPEIVE